jgi:peptide/nickel transport system permease protein
MRLRTYLVRRAIHTVITLLVVVVLLFVIFRLMPGDPSRFFIAPGQPPQVQDELCVSFGLCKWVSAPGNGYESQITAGAPGPYNVTVFVNDTRGNFATYLFVYNNLPTPDAQRRSHPGVSITEVTLSAGGRPGRPSLPDGVPGDTITLRAKVEVVPGPMTAGLQVLKPDRTSVTPTTFTDPTPSFLNWSLVATDPGFYWGILSAGNATTTVDITLGFAVNVPPASFELIEDKFFGRRPAFPPDRAIISVNVTSRVAPIANVTASVESQGGSFVQPDIRLRHPLQAVRRSIGEQFVLYFASMLSGNFGTSFYTRRPVTDEISLRIGPTLLLFGSAVVISYTLGILLGAILAWRRGTKMELSAIVVSLFFYSMPVFWFGLVLLWFFAFNLRVFPLQGIGGFDATGTSLTGFALVQDVLWHMTLPLVNLVILGLAGHVLLMRNSMLEVMGEDYILTAKAKGIRESRVMYRHAARNALLPVVTALAISIGGVISGGVLTETIFSWPGMGFFLVTSTLQQDYPSVQAAFFILAVITILANTVADVLYAYLDPRVRL